MISKGKDRSDQSAGGPKKWGKNLVPRVKSFSMSTLIKNSQFSTFQIRFRDGAFFNQDTNLCLCIKNSRPNNAFLIHIYTSFNDIIVKFYGEERFRPNFCDVSN